MHEDTYSSDVSNLPGPLPANVTIQYFHVLQKKGDFSGMCPAFDFVDDSTVVTLSFGRENITLLLLHVSDTITILDQINILGRGSKIMELIGKKEGKSFFTIRQAEPILTCQMIIIITLREQISTYLN